MSSDATKCHHVAIGLPGGSCYDGGRGVTSRQGLLARRPKGTHLVEMSDFELSLLEKWSYGLDRIYRACPDYSDEVVYELIANYLAMLRRDRIQP